VRSDDVGLMTDELMEKAGHQGGDRWWLYGHGIGKDFYMTPVIPSRGRGAHLVDTYEPGMGFTIELFLRHEGVGLAAFECDGIVTESGHELLDTTPMVWW
jgi:Xaa-Pro dipeptidase